MPQYRVLINKATYRIACSYLKDLKAGKVKPGIYLNRSLRKKDIAKLSPDEFLEILVGTKKLHIIAHHSICGNGSDWIQIELTILGDICIAVPVIVYDNGSSRHPKVHQVPFCATLLYVPCALLKNGNGNIPPDLDKVTIGDRLDYNKYYKLYEKRLLPPFIYSNTVAAAKHKKAFITVPDFECNQFTGNFRGKLRSWLKDVLKNFLEKHGKRFSRVQAVYYDPYSECDNERFEINGISFLVRPFTKGNENKPQLCEPRVYEEYQDVFRDCSLFSLVAWDHVSWPGNDFYLGIRFKDAGIKAAATNSMEVVTGVKGYYYFNNNTYKPLERYVCWNTVVTQNEIKLQVKDNLMVVSL